MKLQRLLAATLVALTIAGSAEAQRKKKTPKWKIDPYTKNDPKEIAKFGYVSYGPFEFGQRGEKLVTTEDVQNHLSYEQILWVETEHLRIGTMLDSWTVPADPQTKKKIRGELERMVARTGNKKIKPKARRLDPWLRLHLIAQRMEEHYAEFMDYLCVEDADFPAKPEDVIIGKGEYMGMGPFLGQTGKYLIFISEAESTMNDYLKNFTGRDTKYGQRWNFKLPGSLLYAIATEMEDGRLKHDTALHGNLVYNMTHNLVDGYRFYSYDAPVWVKTGIAHWFERRVTPKWNTFDHAEGGLGDARKAWRWEPETRKIISGKKFTSFSEAYTWRNYGQINFHDHVALWSRWDYLMSQGKEKFGKFMKGVQGLVDPKTYQPADSNLVESTRKALQDAYGLSPLSIDDRWIDWVKENYSTK